MSDLAFKLATTRVMTKTIGDCEHCGLCKTRNTVVVGQGVPNPRVMFIGEAPGENEDLQGVPFVGRAGQYLKKLFRDSGGQGEWCYLTNVVKCRPPKNRKPTKSEVAACEPWLNGQLAVFKPKIIVCVGEVAAHVILKPRKRLGMADLRGRWFDREGGTRVRVIYHPSYLMQYGQKKQCETLADLEAIWHEARWHVGE